MRHGKGKPTQVPCHAYPDLFQDLEGDEAEALWNVENTEAGRWMCASCPLRDKCVPFSVQSDVDGFAGGLTPAERATIRTELGIADPPPVRLQSLSAMVLARAYARFPDYSLDQMAEHFSVDRATIRRRRRELFDHHIISFDGLNTSICAGVDLCGDLEQSEPPKTGLVDAIMEKYEEITALHLESDSGAA